MNNRNNKKIKKKKPLSPMEKFLKTVVMIVVPFALIITLFTVGSVWYTMANRPQVAGSTDYLDNQGGENDKGQTATVEKKQKAEQVTVALLGVDKEGLRTDVMIVATYNSITHNIDLISVPRDTRYELSDGWYQQLHGRNPHTPSVVKLNELLAYAGGQNYTYTVEALEKVTGMTIDHYVRVDFRAFRKIVDIIGPVEMYIPQALHYQDPYQGLYINVPKGMQKLNGAQAEGVVRYRHGYSNGDLGRIEMQHAFIDAFMKQALQVKNIFKIGDIINTMFEYVKTDMGLDEMLAYGLKYGPTVRPENISMYTIPGEAKYVNTKSYFIQDVAETQKIINEILNPKPVETVKTESSKDKKIMILNGSFTNGLAGEFQNILTKEGYKVNNIGNYDGDRVSQTKIYVKSSGQGSDLVRYFTDAEVIVDAKEVPAGEDIKIVIGASQNS